MNDGFVKSPDAALRFILPLLSQGQAYCGVRHSSLIPQDSRALPAAFLRSRPIFATFKTFYAGVNEWLVKKRGIRYKVNPDVVVMGLAVRNGDSIEIDIVT